MHHMQSTILAKGTQVQTITSLLQKQKINTKSSTETELIGVDEALPQMLWTKSFLKEE